MKWQYNRKKKQDEAEGKSHGPYRITFIVGRYDGMFRLAMQSWKVKPAKFFYMHIIGDMGRLIDAKRVAEILNASDFVPYRDNLVNLKAIKQHLDAAIHEIES